MDNMNSKNIIDLADFMIEEFDIAWVALFKQNYNQLDYYTIKLYVENLKEQRNLIISVSAFNSEDYPDLQKKRKRFMQKYIPLIAAAEIYLMKYKIFDTEEAITSN